MFHHLLLFSLVAFIFSQTAKSQNVAWINPPIAGPDQDYSADQVWAIGSNRNGNSQPAASRCYSTTDYSGGRYGPSVFVYLCVSYKYGIQDTDGFAYIQALWLRSLHGWLILGASV
jgi:hypothetical protein